jgi:class 3 adenylate cyclase
VTVLFADVVHSMDIAAAVGAERLREIMAELLDRSTAVVKRYGGTVDKFTGDGIMAVFGAPVAGKSASPGEARHWESPCPGMSGIFRAQMNGATRMGRAIRFTGFISTTPCGSRRWSFPSPQW